MPAQRVDRIVSKAIVSNRYGRSISTVGWLRSWPHDLLLLLHYSTRLQRVYPSVEGGAARGFEDVLHLEGVTPHAGL